MSLLTDEQREDQQREYNLEQKYEPALIKGVSISMLSNEQIKSMSVCVIDKPKPTEESGALYDKRMGSQHSMSHCESGQCLHVDSSHRRCLGKYGRIELKIPILSFPARKMITLVVGCICPCCGEIKKNYNTLNDAGVFKLTGFERLNAIFKLCNGEPCDTPDQGCEKYYPRFFKLKSDVKDPKKLQIHKFRTGVLPFHIISKTVDIEQPGDIREHQNQLRLRLPKEPVNPNPKVIKPFKGQPEKYRYDYMLSLADTISVLAIADSRKNAEILFDEPTTRISNAVIDNVLVLPPVKRPVDISGPINSLYIGVISANNSFSQIMPNILNWKDPRYDSNYEPLEAAQPWKEEACIAYYNLSNALYNLTTKKFDPNSGGYAEPKKSIFDLISGKQSLIRQTLSSKMDHCSRIVAGCDMDLEIDQIGIGPEVASKMTVKEVVLKSNNLHIQSLNGIGSIKYVEINGRKIEVNENNRDKINIEPGVIVHRLVRPGDRVIMWRSPTIKTEGVRSYRLFFQESESKKRSSKTAISKPSPSQRTTSSTINVHIAVVNSGNLDFDGDEIHLKTLQESEHIIDSNIYLSPQQTIKEKAGSYNAMGVTEQYIYTAYMLTDDIMIDDLTLINDIYVKLSDSATADSADLGARLRKQGVSRFSGKGIFSMILPRSLYYDNGGVKIVDGILTHGRIKKSHIGYHSRISLIDAIAHDIGDRRAYDFLSDIYALLQDYSLRIDLSISLFDAMPIQDIVQSTQLVKSKGNKQTVKKVGGRHMDQSTRDEIRAMIEEIDDSLADELMSKYADLAFTLSKPTAERNRAINKFKDLVKESLRGYEDIEDLLDLIDYGYLRSYENKDPIRTINTKIMVKTANEVLRSDKYANAPKAVQERIERDLASDSLSQMVSGVMENLDINLKNVIKSGAKGSDVMTTKLYYGAGGITDKGRVMTEYIKDSGRDVKTIDEIGISSGAFVDGLTVQQELLSATKSRNNEIGGKVVGVPKSGYIHRQMDHALGNMMSTDMGCTVDHQGTVTLTMTQLDNFDTRKLSRVSGRDTPFDIKRMVYEAMYEILAEQTRDKLITYDELEKDSYIEEIDQKLDLLYGQLQDLEQTTAKSTFRDPGEDINANTISQSDEYISSRRFDLLNQVQMMKRERLRRIDSLEKVESYQITQCEQRILDIRNKRTKTIYSMDEAAKSSIIARHMRVHNRSSAYQTKDEASEIIKRRVIKLERGDKPLFYIPNTYKQIAQREFELGKLTHMLARYGNQRTNRDQIITKVINERIKQLKSGDQPLYRHMTSAEIATREYQLGLIDYTITRSYPDGSAEVFNKDQLIPIEI